MVSLPEYESRRYFQAGKSKNKSYAKSIATQPYDQKQYKTNSCKIIPESQ